MIRIIVRQDDAGMAANVGGAVKTTFRTIDIEIPELEYYLQESGPFMQRTVVGIECKEPK